MIRRTRRHRSHKRSTTLHRRRYGKGRKSGRKCRKTRRMRGGLDAQIIANQCNNAYQSKAEKINNYAKTRGVEVGLSLCTRLSRVLAQDKTFPNNFFATL